MTPKAGLALVTGTSSGLGLELARTLLSNGWTVCGIQRRSSPLRGTRGYQEICHDLTDFENTRATLGALLPGAPSLDLVVLNAGVLGELADLAETSLDELKRVMDVNTWANKVLLDSLFTLGLEPRQVVGISSGAAVSGSRGWSSYALSKATFVMLLKLYAAERPATHFASLAPGLVDTAMQDHICGLPESVPQRYPSVRRIQASRGTDDMPSPERLAARLFSLLPQLLDEPSGAYLDIRTWRPRALSG